MQLTLALDTWQPVAAPPTRAEYRQLLDDLQAPTFVSTPGLLLDVPYAHVLPVVIDPTLWVTGAPALRQTRLRVLHVPSNPVPKGTLLIEPTLRRLHDEGVIEHITVPFGAEHSAMPALIAPSPITAITSWFAPARSRATAMPSDMRRS